MRRRPLFPCRKEATDEERRAHRLARLCFRALEHLQAALEDGDTIDPFNPVHAARFRREHRINEAWKRAIFVFSRVDLAGAKRLNEDKAREHLRRLCPDDPYTDVLTDVAGCVFGGAI